MVTELLAAGECWIDERLELSSNGLEEGLKLFNEFADLLIGISLKVDEVFLDGDRRLLHGELILGQSRDHCE